MRAQTSDVDSQTMTISGKLADGRPLCHVVRKSGLQEHSEYAPSNVGQLLYCSGALVNRRH